MNKLDYLLKFRRSSNEETLEKVIEHMEPKVSKDDYDFFLAAADHRRAELACKKTLIKFLNQLGNLSNKGGNV